MLIAYKEESSNMIIRIDNCTNQSMELSTLYTRM